VERYEPAIRRAVRFRLSNAGLRRLLDSTDICQSVFGSFFVRLAAGQYHIERKEDLLNLLITMAQHKLVSQARHEQAECRDRRRTKADGREVARLAASTPSPSQEVTQCELLAEVERRLSAEERQLMAMRREGQSWEEIAVLVGDSPVVLRKRLSRALDRITRELGLEVGGHD
jgi:RNA polymerase sigma-70 factor (ECF subfamily)